MTNKVVHIDKYLNDVNFQIFVFAEKHISFSTRKYCYQKYEENNRKKLSKYEVFNLFEFQ